MSLGPGEHEVRKLQSTGGSTFTLSLPKPWINEFDLEARDSLRVDWRPSGALRITPFQQLIESIVLCFLTIQIYLKTVYMTI